MRATTRSPIARGCNRAIYFGVRRKQLRGRWSAISMGRKTRAGKNQGDIVTAPLGRHEGRKGCRVGHSRYARDVAGNATIHGTALGRFCSEENSAFRFHRNFRVMLVPKRFTMMALLGFVGSVTDLNLLRMRTRRGYQGRRRRGDQPRDTHDG